MNAFIARWKGKQGAERANYQLFLSELCDALKLPRPDPASDATQHNAYVFERAVTFHKADGKATTGRIDLYKRGCFVLEAKQYLEQPEQANFHLTAELSPKKAAPVRGTTRWDDAMFKARAQAERYARALPADEDPPPFLIVVDVGHSFELFADFTQKGKDYLPFPDPASHRFKLDGLAADDIRERLRAVWMDPAGLDPAKHAAAVTREVAAHLAELAKSFEADGHEPKLVADFLARCLFCMFAEDVGLLPKDSFTSLLDSIQGNAGGFVPLIEGLFKEMNTGAAYSLILRQKLLRFNGGLFEDNRVLHVNSAQLGLLRSASKLNWRNVEPSIFGTLLERALNPDERHKLGAHYTPRAYVERLVLPTVIEPLREEWFTVRTAAVTHARAGRMPEAVAEVRDFHARLCHVRVLDPACGSGNFLYVTLEHMKRLEGEILDQLNEFGDRQALLDLATITVDPHQFLGIEVNPRAAAVTDLVLWIGYLQWHFRTRGKTLPSEPVLKKFANIQCRDAVLAYDKEEPVTWLMAASDPDIPGVPDPVRQEIARRRDEILAAPEKFRHKLVDVWDRKSFKSDPVTGREVPDETKRAFLRRYTNPRPAEWPPADFIVGNPPFLGKLKVRQDLGDGYAETLRAAYTEVPESSDFVMYWWYQGAMLTLDDRCRRFGFITTNSVRQTFNRRVLNLALDRGLSIRFAIPDHPWVDTADGAAVRIAMTVGGLSYKLPMPGMVKEPPPPDPSALMGDLYIVIAETPRNDGSADVKLSCFRGRIGSGLNIGAELEGAVALEANGLLSSTGLILGGRGFVLSAQEAELLKHQEPEAKKLLFPLRNGEDITAHPRNVYVIDTHGWSAEELRKRTPVLYQHLYTTVFTERQSNRDTKLRKQWWLFRRSNAQARSAIAGLKRYIITVETTKHRVFQFLASPVRPEHVLIVIGSADAFHLGVLSSRIHVVFALAAGGTLEDRPRYNKTRCFDPFPFPVCDEEKIVRIRALAEELDAHRKRVQAEHGIGLTDMYNVMEKLRASEELTTKEREIHDRALISTLKQLHDELDAAVADAYGWPWPMNDAEILERVVALNKKRADEEARGTIRWLRPDYQKPKGVATKTQSHLDLADAEPLNPKSKIRNPKSKQPWPKTLAEQVRRVEAILVSEGRTLTAQQVAQRFVRARAATVQEILDTLTDLGRI